MQLIQILLSQNWENEKTRLMGKITLGELSAVRHSAQMQRH